MSLFPLLVVGLIAWGAAVAIRRAYAKQRPNIGGEGGVGGWLLLLIVAFVFLGPLMGAAKLNSEIMAAEVQNSGIKALDAWLNYKAAAWWTHAVTSGLSIYAGVGLLRGKTMTSVTLAKVVLWVIGPIASVVLGVALPRIMFGSFEYDAGVTSSLVASAIGAGVWHAYLSRSKRVQATYGLQ